MIGFDELLVLIRQSSEFGDDDVLRAGRNRQDRAAIHINRLVDRPRVPICRKTSGVLVHTVDLEAVIAMKIGAFAEDRVDLF